MEFKEVITKYEKMLKKINRMYGGTEDGFQEAVLEVYEALKTYDESKSGLSTYLYWRVRGKLQRWSKQKKEITQEEGMDMSYQRIENKILVESLKNRLEADERELIELIYSSGMSDVEIAKRYKESVQTIKNKKHSILGKLRKMLKECD